MTEQLRRKVAVLEERLRSMDKALALQAHEYDRRLGELNHAHEQAVQVQHTYVSEEVHERDVAAARKAAQAVAQSAVDKADALALALKEAKDTSDKRFGQIEAFQSKIIGALVLASVFVPMLTGTVVYLLTR